MTVRTPPTKVAVVAGATRVARISMFIVSHIRINLRIRTPEFSLRQEWNVSTLLRKGWPVTRGMEKAFTLAALAFASTHAALYMISNRRVVVTGMGVITPVGNDVE